LSEWNAVFPDAKNLDEFWRNIILGKDSVTEVPDERWNKEFIIKPDSTKRMYPIQNGADLFRKSILIHWHSVFRHNLLLLLNLPNC
jgi:hypothetical protein